MAAMQSIIRFLYVTILFGVSASCNMKDESKVQVPEEVTEQTSQEVWINEDFVLGHYDPEQHEYFTEIDGRYADRTGLYLHKQTYQAFVEMWQAAEADGVTLLIKSATRNFDYQKGIWERKWTGETTLSDGSKASDIENLEQRALKILLYSSMPGTSRHHWGTDIDLNNFTNEYFAVGEGLTIYQWLTQNAATYGFCQPYTDQRSGRTGYNEEKWHWTYTPLSSQLTKYYKDHITNDRINGFKGSEVATTVDMMGRYVLGIAPSCL